MFQTNVRQGFYFTFFPKFLLDVVIFFLGYLGEFLKVLLSTGLDWMCCNDRQAIFLSGFLVSVLYSFSWLAKSITMFIFVGFFFHFNEFSY